MAVLTDFTVQTTQSEAGLLEMWHRPLLNNSPTTVSWQMFTGPSGTHSHRGNDTFGRV